MSLFVNMRDIELKQHERASYHSSGQKPRKSMATVAMTTVRMKSFASRSSVTILLCKII